MPTLPTFDVTTAQGQRILAAYGSEENYLKWLKAGIIDKVRKVEAEKTEAPL